MFNELEPYLFIGFEEVTLLITLKANKIYECNRTVIYFNIGKNNWLFIVTEKEGQLFLEVIEHKKILFRIHLKAYSEDSYIYLIEAYKDKIYVVLQEDHICN